MSDTGQREAPVATVPRPLGAELTPLLDGRRLFELLELEDDWLAEVDAVEDVEPLD